MSTAVLALPAPRLTPRRRRAGKAQTFRNRPRPSGHCAIGTREADPPRRRQVERPATNRLNRTTLIAAPPRPSPQPHARRAGPVATCAAETTDGRQRASLSILRPSYPAEDRRPRRGASSGSAELRRPRPEPSAASAPHLHREKATRPFVISLQSFPRGKTPPQFRDGQQETANDHL
jgi:hypothetical protein